MPGLTTIDRALNVTRRTILFAPLLAAAVASSTSGQAAATTSRSNRDTLRHVRNWGCQYQNVDLDEIAASSLEMIVIDPSLNDSERVFVSKSDCERLRVRPDGGRRIVLAYLCVGEVDVKRWYLPAEWSDRLPGWVGKENPNWAGAHSVEFWRPEWRSLIFEGSNSVLGHIIDAGFDGVFLDRVDGYGDWDATRPSARAEMIDLVAALADTARGANPDFVIVAQNAEPLLTSTTLVASLDGHNKESLLTGLQKPNAPNSEQDVEWSLSFIRGLQNHGTTTFATEYLTDASLIGGVRSKLIQLGFVPFFGVRALDVLPGTLGSGN